MTLAIILGAALFLAYSNGANDNFKGVATLYGSGVVGFRTALWWGTAATFAGSLTAALIGEKLIKLFSGSGLVPDVVIADPAFLTAVILGAGITVFVTAKAGIPISTTHALTGGLVGAGLAAASDAFQFEPLLQKFLIPLAIAPLIPVVVIGFVYPVVLKFVSVVRSSRLYEDFSQGLKRPELARLAVTSDGHTRQVSVEADRDGALADESVYFAKMCDVAHFVSAGTVSFARGLNDAPKIVGVAIAAGALSVNVSIYAVAIAMAIGGLLHSRAVAESMSHKITQISHQQGIVANIFTSLMVLFASKFGVPVSTTHVSVGSIFGIGTARGEINSRLVIGIVSAWVLTLPVAMTLAAVMFFVFSRVG